MTQPVKPEVTLIISSTVDGRLVGRDSDELDANKGWKESKMVRGIVQQFFEFSTDNQDVYNFVTAASVLRLGINSTEFQPKKENVSLVVFDEAHQLSPEGIANLAASVKKLVLVSDQAGAESPKLPLTNCRYLHYDKPGDISAMVHLLAKHAITKLTVQSAGLLNSQWLQSGVVDFLTVIMYPLVVSTNGTSTFVESEFGSVKPLKLISATAFDTDYLLLRYQVLN